MEAEIAPMQLLKEFRGSEGIRENSDWYALERWVKKEFNGNILLPELNSRYTIEFENEQDLIWFKLRV